MQRRSFLIGGGLLAAGGIGPAIAQVLRRTPGQILGPYYPVIKPSEVDADLSRLAGRQRRGAGQIIRVSGRVLTQAGRPVPNAQIEVWQADAQGRYAHPSDRTADAADPDFQGFADFRTDADGHYGFVSIKPGPYADDGAGGMRAPHIYLQVTGRVNRLATQLYFSGEPLNDTDRVLAFANEGRDRLMLSLSTLRRADGVAAGTWDIVLRDG